MAIVTQKVLVLKTSSLGDIMHGLQLAQTLKENDPGIEITWVVRSRFERLVRASSAVDETIAFFRTGGISAFFNLCGKLRQQRFDVVLDLQGLARTGLMTLFSRAPRKVGRSDAREGASLFYKELVPMPRGIEPVHPVDILLEFCRVFGFETKLLGSVQFSLSESQYIDRPEGEKRVTIAPDGRRPDMEWKSFQTLTATILKRNPSVSVRILTAKSLDWGDAFQKEFGNRVAILRSSDPLKVAGLLQSSDLLVANDSDAVHMAAAMGTKTIGLFGPTDGNKIGPYPLSEPRNCAINAPNGDLSALALEKVVEEVQRRL